MANTKTDVSFEPSFDDTLEQIARALWCLSRRKGADAHYDELGAVEFLAAKTGDGLEDIAQAINKATGLEFLATEARAGMDGIAAALNNVAASIRETKAATGTEVGLKSIRGSEDGRSR